MFPGYGSSPEYRQTESANYTGGLKKGNIPRIQPEGLFFGLAKIHSGVFGERKLRYKFGTVQAIKYTTCM